MRRIVLASLALSLAAGPALAHSGPHGAGGLAAGFGHPFAGLDHLLAMIAVGLWAGLAAPKRPWLWPAAFLIFMVAGFAAGSAGLAVRGAEALIAASVIALGLAAAARWTAPAALGCALVGLFALAHGFAHGAEAPANVSGAAFAAGFVAATALFHGAGMALAKLAATRSAERLPRVAGLGVACAGLALVWAG